MLSCPSPSNPVARTNSELMDPCVHPPWDHKIKVGNYWEGCLPLSQRVYFPLVAVVRGRAMWVLQIML